MKQLSLASSRFDKFGRAKKRSVFLAEMDRVVQWSALCELVEPVYPQNEVGRPPVGLERMLRIHFLQAWFNLSDPAVEKALYLDREPYLVCLNVHRPLSEETMKFILQAPQRMVTRSP